MWRRWTPSAPMASRSHSSSRAYLSLAGAACLWGTGFLLGKFALVELDVPHMIMYRLLLACAGFVPVLVMRAGRAVARRRRRLGDDQQAPHDSIRSDRDRDARHRRRY